MPSFDVVSKTDLNEVDNALANIAREIGTRFDFKGADCRFEREESVLTLHADDPPKAKQMHELLTTHFVRRKIDPKVLDFQEQERASGDRVRQKIVIKQGIDRDLAKQITTAVKQSKLKVQASIQGDEVRITGKKRDDLQEAIAMLRGLKIEQPLQFVNFRD